MSREKEELQGVTLLGNQKTKYPQDYAPEMLETFILISIRIMIILKSLTAWNLQAFVQ